MIKALKTTKKTIAVALGFALISAIVLSYTVVTPAFAEIQQRAELADNCANATIPANAERNTVLDADKGILLVEVVSGDSVSKFALPYEPEKDFRGCSQDARNLLVHVQEAHDAKVADMCESFKAVVNGDEPLPEKNGEKANIQGAIDYIDRYCD